METLVRETRGTQRTTGAGVHAWISTLLCFARGAWRELPLETLAVGVAAVSCIAAVHDVAILGERGLWPARLILGSVLATPLFFVVTLVERQGLVTRNSKLAMGAIIAACVLGALVAWLPDVDALDRSRFAWPYGLAALAAVLIPFVAVAWCAGRGDPTIRERERSDAEAPAGPPGSIDRTAGPPGSIDRTAGPPGSIDRTAGPPGSIDRTAGPPGSIDRTAGPPGSIDRTAGPPGSIDRVQQFTCFVRRFFEQSTTWGLLWLGAMAALAVVFTALHELFGLRVERWLADASVLTTGCVALSYLFRLLPSPGHGEQQARLPEFWRRLVTAVGAPFVSVMLVILVAYEAVVLIRGELPVNLLSPLIIGAGFVGFFCTLVIVSILGERVGSDVLSPAESHRWARSIGIRLARAFPVVLLVLLPMAGWALALRIEQYGFTPLRVARLMALVCLALLCALGTARWLRGRKTLTWEVPACTIAVALVTAFGPLSAVQLSIDSQTERLERQLTRAGIGERTVSEELPPVAYPVEHEVYWELGGQIATVAELGGERALRRVFDGNVEACAQRWQSDRCLGLVGIGSAADTPAADPVAAVPTTTADRAWADGSFTTDQGRLEFVALRSGDLEHASGVWLELHSRSVHMVRDGKELAEGSLDGLIAAWRETTVLPARLVELRDSAGVVVARLAVHTLEVDGASGQTAGEEARVSSLDGVLLRPLIRPE